MEIMDKIDKYSLDYKKAYLYFIEHVQDGNALSLAIVKNINFQLGQFYTFLPENADGTRLYEFSCGGIIPGEREKCQREKFFYSLNFNF